MLFQRSTKSIVQGNRLEQAIQPGPLKTEQEPKAPSPPKHRKLLPGILIACVVLLLLFGAGQVYVMYFSNTQEPEAEEETLNGQMMVSLKTGLESQLAAGDVLRLYTADGPISSLRYVEVQSVSDSATAILLTEDQLEDYLAAGNEILPALVIHQDAEAAKEALELQAAWNDPEISIVVPEALSLAVEETVSLDAEVSVMPDGAILPGVSYQSSDPDVVSVDENGTLTANTSGQAVITVQCGDESASCAVTALLVAQELSFESREIVIGVGGNAALTPKASPTDYSETLKWTSSDETVAAVDSGGTVTGIAEGEAKITVSGQNASASYTVIVETEVEHISLNRDTMLLTEGNSGALAAAVTPEDASDKTLTWESSDESVATVDADGTVTAIAEGDTIITVSSGSVTAICVVTVIAPAWPETTDQDNE